MNLKEWKQTFKPVNQRQMYETYGGDYDFLSSQPEENIWTYCGVGDERFIVSGYHFVNRLGYLVTEKPCPPDQEIVVDLEEDDDLISIESDE